MTYRKFKGIQYPVPGVDTAISILRPGAKFDLKNTDFVGWEDRANNTEPPAWEEVEEELKREVDIYNYYLYERNREKAYPHVKEQLDMLYHDIKNGNLENGSWIAAIEKVKEEHPKPEGPEPEL